MMVGFAMLGQAITLVVAGLEIFERGMRDTLQFINDCLKLGLLQLAPKTGRKP